jgi:adenine phosphoribosyltransferase
MSSSDAAATVSRLVRDIPDWPQPGVVFKDITPLLNDPQGFTGVIDALVDAGSVPGLAIDRVVGVEARGFVFAAPVAYKLGAGFVPVRKPGKLPYQTLGLEYALEYGTDRLEMHCDAVKAGSRVLLFDDVLATGGTMRACCDLVSRTGAEIVSCLFVVELGALQGRTRLEPYETVSLLTY